MGQRSEQPRTGAKVRIARKKGKGQGNRGGKQRSDKTGRMGKVRIARE